MRKTLRDKISDPKSLEDLDKIIATKERDQHGNRLAVYEWTPLCPPWHPKSNCTFQRDVFYCKADIIAALSANGCVGGETVVSADGRPVREIDGPFQCWSWDGSRRVLATAMPPVVVGVDRLFTVRLADGSSFRATDDHLVFSSDGWRLLSECRREFASGRRVSIAGSARSVRGEGDPRWTETPSGSPPDCRASDRSHDERLPSAAAGGRAPLPSRDDVRGRSPSFVLADESAYESGRSHPHRRIDHLSSTGAAIQAESREAEFSDGGLGTNSRQGFWRHPAPCRLSSAASSASRSGLEAELPGTGSSSAQRLHFVDVIEIGRSNVEAFYDFHVPVFNNYFANGALHHNCGKTELLTYWIACRLRGRVPVFPEVSWPLPQHGWFACEPKEVESTFDRILRYIPTHERESVLRGGHPRLVMKNGGTLEPRSYAQKSEEWAGANLHFIGMNEEPYPKQWTEGRARLRLPGAQLFIAATLARGANFIHDVLDLSNHEKYLNSLEGVRLPSTEYGEGSRLSIFTAATTDNAELPKDYVPKLIESCRRDSDMIAIRVQGKILSLRGKHIFGHPDLRDGMKFQFERLGEPKRRIFFDDRGRAKPADPDDTYESWMIWEEPIGGAQYVQYADSAMGIKEEGKSDFSAVGILNADTGNVAAIWHGKQEPSDLAQDMFFAGHWYNRALTNWEFNPGGGGSSICDRLLQLHYPRLAMRRSFGGRVQSNIRTYGLMVGANEKRAIVMDLRSAIQDKRLVVHYREAFNELLNFGYIRKDEASARDHGMAALSGHDDLVMMLAGLWRTAKGVGAAHVPERPKPKSVVQAWIESQNKGQAAAKKHFRPLTID